MSQDRSEKPTAKRLRDARKKGQVARSRDLAVAAATVAATIAVAQFGARLVGGLGDQLARDLTHFGDDPLRTITAADLQGLVAMAMTAVIMFVGPIALVTMAAGIAAQGAQGGWIVAPERMHVDWTRLSPIHGLKRFQFLQSGADTLKTLTAVAVIGWFGWSTIEAMLAEAAQMPWMAPAAAAALGWTHVESFLWKVAWGLGALALADYGLQRYRLMSSLRMTKQEVRDEARQNEGSAEVKGRVRAIQREMARRRMINDVGRATVVVTNPTHFAVALEYHRGSMAAPVVRAKGRDHIAARIRDKAREHGIPIVENKPLAQILFKTAEVGEAIPSGLFTAVAEVLAQLIRLKQLTL
jgi:flagellar biosynthetic protein FlhB